VRKRAESCHQRRHEAFAPLLMVGQNFFSTLLAFAHMSKHYMIFRCKGQPLRERAVSHPLLSISFRLGLARSGGLSVSQRNEPARHAEDQRVTCVRETESSRIRRRSIKAGLPSGNFAAFARLRSAAHSTPARPRAACASRSGPQPSNFGPPKLG
jgi:hypothetical protein